MHNKLIRFLVNPWTQLPSNHRHLRIDDVEDGDIRVDGLTKTRGRVFPDGEGNYRKGNSDFLLKLFYYYNLDFYNFSDFKMVIYWYILVWFSL